MCFPRNLYTAVHICLYAYTYREFSKICKKTKTRDIFVIRMAYQRKAVCAHFQSLVVVVLVHNQSLVDKIYMFSCLPRKAPKSSNKFSSRWKRSRRIGQRSEIQRSGARTRGNVDIKEGREKNAVDAGRARRGTPITYLLPTILLLPTPVILGQDLSLCGNNLNLPGNRQLQ